MEKHGAVWACPELYVPPGRMIEPYGAAFWVSWQNDHALEDAVVTGADAAVRWGRERTAVVMIRLGHIEASYFSAGDEHPAKDVPEWPPSRPPAEGWWQPPPPPTHDEVRDVATRVERHDLTATDAGAWAEERLQVHASYLAEQDMEAFRMLCSLRDGMR